MPALQASCDDGSHEMWDFCDFGHFERNTKYLSSLCKSCPEASWALAGGCETMWSSAVWKPSGNEWLGSHDSVSGLRKAHHETDRLDDWILGIFLSTTVTDIKLVLAYTIKQSYSVHLLCISLHLRRLWTFSLSYLTAWSSGGRYFGFCEDGFAVPQA